MNRSEGIAAIKALFQDEGLSVLAEGGTYGTWEDALAGMPDGLFALEGDPAALTMFTVARDLFNRNGDLRMASAMTRGLISWHVANHGTEHPDTLTELGALGFLAIRAGREDEGGAMLERAMEGLKAVLAGRDIRLAVVAGNLGLYYARAGHLEEAESALEQAFKIRKHVAPDSVGNVAGQLGEVRLRMERYEEALEALRTAWMAELDAHGEHHPRTVQRGQTLARLLNQLGQFREAVAMWRSLDGAAMATGLDAPIADIGFQLGVALYNTRKRDEATRRILDSIERTRRMAADRPHPDLPERLAFFARMELDAGRALEAEGLLSEVVEVESRISGADSPETARRYIHLATLQAEMGRLDEAMGVMDGATALLRGALGDGHPDCQAAIEATMDVFLKKAEQLAAVEARREAAELLRHARDLGAALGPNHPNQLALRQLASTHKLRL